MIDGKEMLKSIVEHDNDISKAPISYWKKVLFFMFFIVFILNRFIIILIINF